MSAGASLHQERVLECPFCHKPTEPEPRYDWCPACRGAFVCACDGCQAFEALRLMGS